MDGWSGFGDRGVWGGGGFVVLEGYGLEGGMLEGCGDWRDERDTAAWMKSCWEKMRDLEDKKDTATVKS